MKIVESINGITLVRETGDKALSHETNVVHHMRRLLNERDGGGWVRCWPHKLGLTSCTQGVANWSAGVLYWHANYMIEMAHKAYNAGQVFFLKDVAWTV